MSTGTNISWTEATWNPVVGCTRVSAGCDSCYAVTMTHRLESYGQEKYTGLTVVNGKGDRHFNGTVRTVESVLDQPLKWRKPRMIFVNSMSDLFHREVPFEFIDRVFAVMALCPQHTFQVLTKRPERMQEYFRSARVQVLSNEPGSATTQWHIWSAHHALGRHSIEMPWSWCDGKIVGPWPLSNVWLGTSVEDQKAADERIPHLLRVPAAVRFLSCEPLLGPLLLCGTADQPLAAYSCYDNGEPRWERQLWQGPFAKAVGESGIDWVIVGGESGPGARPCNLAWVQSLVEQCKAAGVACFVKQDSGYRAGMQGRIPDELWVVKEFPKQEAEPCP